jgi:hypothetical protein
MLLIATYVDAGFAVDIRFTIGIVTGVIPQVLAPRFG